MAARPRASGADVVRFPRSRRIVVDIGRVAGRRATVTGFILVDVTDARRRLAAAAAAGRPPSLTAYVVAGVARAVAAETAVHALRDLRRRLVRFRTVDVNVMVEVELEERSFPMNHVVRAADRRPVADIGDELRRVKRQPADSPTAGLDRAARVFLSLPGVLRRAALRLLYRLPAQQRALAGTVGVTSIGMFGAGGGWGTAFQVHPLDVVVGGISVRTGVDGHDHATRELLHLTLGFDHDVVDGAPAARFAARLRRLLEDPDALLGPTDASG